MTGVDSNPLDVSLHDEDLHDGVALMTKLIVAANDFDEHLPQEEIDRTLGVSARG